MQELPLFLVINASSGRGDTQQAIELARDKLTRAGRPHEFFMVRNSAQLAAHVAEATRAAQARGGALVGVGGDGTLNAVAQHAHAIECPMGILPRGTFNYFGRTHGISQELDAALDALLQAVPQPIQIGQINGHLFLVNASLGLYPRLLQDRETYKQQFGRRRIVAFAASAMTLLLQDHRALLLQIEHDGGEQILFTSTLFVGNNALQLEQVGIAEADAVPGQLAAVAVRPGSRMKMLGLLLRGALGNLGASEHVDSFAFTHLTVRPRLPHGRKRIKVAIDGEIFWFDTPLRFNVAPRPLYLLKP